MSALVHAVLAALLLAVTPAARHGGPADTSLQPALRLGPTTPAVG